MGAARSSGRLSMYFVICNSTPEARVRTASSHTPTGLPLTQRM